MQCDKVQLTCSTNLNRSLVSSSLKSAMSAMFVCVPMIAIDPCSQALSPFPLSGKSTSNMLMDFPFLSFLLHGILTRIPYF